MPSFSKESDKLKYSSRVPVVSSQLAVFDNPDFIAPLFGSTDTILCKAIMQADVRRA